MGKLLGVEEVKIFVPKGLDESIVRSIEGEGADVVVVEGCYDDSVRVAHQWGEETEGGMLIEGTAFEGYEDVPKVCYVLSFRGISMNLSGLANTLLWIVDGPGIQ